MQTIEFTTVDAASELPPPMTVNEIISRTLAQKKMAAMVMEDTVDEVEAVRARHAAEQEAAQAQANGAAGEADGMMDVSDDEDEEVKERKRREEEERGEDVRRSRSTGGSRSLQGRRPPRRGSGPCCSAR